MMSCPLPIVPVIQPLPTLNTQADFPIHIGIKVSLNSVLAIRCNGCVLGSSTTFWAFVKMDRSLLIVFVYSQRFSRITVLQLRE